MKKNSTYYHIIHLDGIRGLSVILVIFHHFFEFIKFSEFCYIGVDSFFVLSGFLITGILLRNNGSQFYFRNFYIKRMLRIFPLYYLTLILFFILYPMLNLNWIYKYDYLCNNQLWFWTFFQNWLIIYDGWLPNRILGHFWSLAIEEQYYFVWPFLVYFLSKNKLVFLCVILFFLSPILRHLNTELPYVYVCTFTRLEGLVLGSLIAILFENNKININNYKYYIYIIMIFIVLYFSFQDKWTLGELYNMKIGYTLTPLFFSLLLLSTFIDNKPGKYLRFFFSNSILTFTGKISYGLYIYHNIFFYLFRPHLERFLSKFSQNISIVNIEIGLILIVFTYMVSYISFLFFESKITNMKHLFIK